MIESITQSVAYDGRSGGMLWFHPRACRVPVGTAPYIFMTAQGISGSDYFHPVHWMTSSDLGATWSEPVPVPGFARESRSDGIEEGVCDVVPEFHPQTGRIIAMGHNVFYRGGSFFQPQPPRKSVYNIYDPATGSWLGRHPLEWDNEDASYSYSCGCAQRYTYEDGTMLIPLTFSSKEGEPRRVCTVAADFNGERIDVRRMGNVLELAVKRGLLEPSVTRQNGTFYMTLRAEDDRGYVVRSNDGLEWSAIEAWTWDDGEPLTMSTTQQRWVTHSEGLYLVYTRRSEDNINVMRWRAPLFIARVDTDSLRLVRDSERVVVPMVGDGVNDPDHVARLGNFHTVNASSRESWVTVGESLPKDGYRGNTLIGRIRWSVPNDLI